MNEQYGSIGKISQGMNGLGAPDEETVERRALELAKIDGRKEPNDGDRLLAMGELQGAIEPQQPEASPEIESITTWDEAPSSHGVEAPSRGPDDEQAAGEILVEEGLEEADHDLRLAAVDRQDEESADIDD